MTALLHRVRRGTALAVLGVWTAAACDARPAQPPLGFDRMRDQPRYDPFQPSRYFRDGKAMQAPPGGTVSTDGAPERPDVSPVSAPPITPDGIARGRNRYDIFCAPCHDLDGSADAPVARNMQLRHPPSLLASKVRAFPAARIYGVITDGYGLMPSYAHQLSTAERWDVIAYVRALQLRTAVALTDLPPSMRTEASQALGGRGAP